MRALLSQEPGPPATLAIVEIDDPVPGAGEIVVRMEATALNFFDTLIIADRYQFKPQRPFSPGAEGAGVVEAVGEGVTEVAAGDPVVVFKGHGCCQDKVLVRADSVFRRPPGLAADIAAGLAVTYGTTLYALEARAGLEAGETLAVLGAAGGTGLAAVEIGKLMGARVIACASSPEKLAVAREAGADETVDYRAEKLRDRLKQLTGGDGVDVIYDPVGGDLAEQALRGIGWLGRYLVIGFAAGDIPRFPLNLVLLKGCDVRGVFWGGFVERDPAAHHKNMARLLDWAAAGKLKPRIDSRTPLADAPAALERLAAGKVIGKALIVF